MASAGLDRGLVALPSAGCAPIPKATRRSRSATRPRSSPAEAMAALGRRRAGEDRRTDGVPELLAGLSAIQGELRDDRPREAHGPATGVSARADRDALH